MKRIFQLVALVVFGFLFSQKVSDFHYIYVPEKFEDFKDKNYGLNEQLINSLKAKKYGILTVAPDKEEAGECKTLYADIKNSSSMLRNKVTLEFTDCNGKKIFSQQGTSYLKEFEPGFQEALKFAVATLPFSAGQATVIREKTGNTERSEAEGKPAEIQEKISKATASNLFVSNSGKKFEKVTNNNGFDLRNSENGQMTTFRKSTKSGVYHVIYEGRIMTLGYEKGNTFVIDLPKDDGSYEAMVFEEK